MSGSGVVRAIALVLASAATVLAAGFLIQAPFATGIWPFPVSSLTYTFLAAYALGSVAALAWVGSTGELAGLGPLGLTTAVAYGAMAVAFVGYASSDQRFVFNLAVTTALSLAGLAAMVIGLRQQVRDRRQTARPLRVTEVVVAVLLMILGVPLLLRIPDVMPWVLDLDSGVLIGCMFLGSAAYFLHGGLRRGWAMATGPLAALLAYDIVLTLPLVAQYSVARPEHVTVLTLYSGVLVSSAILGAYVFLVDRRTRVRTTS